MPQKTKKEKNKKNLWIFLLGCAAALFPQYYIRSSYDIYYFLFKKFRTYPGDLWYCWNNYLSRGHAYPREYPSGIQVIFRFIFKVKPDWFNYEWYMMFMSLFLGTLALMITYFLYHLVIKTHHRTGRIWLYWILAPSFLFYALLNLDLLSIFTIVIAYYLFLEEEYYLAAAMLALGTTIKVFPVFLTPLLFFQCPRKYRWGSVAAFIITWFAFNLPFMITEWDAWVFPYAWQIKHNVSDSPTDGTYWWIFYNLFEKIGGEGSGALVGRLSLLLYASLYFMFLKKKWELPLARKCVGIIILFLLTDRIYSPQYNLYLLPFLVLVDTKINKLAFYTAEVLNMIQVMFLFFWKDNPVGSEGLYLQILILIKYVALAYLFVQNWTAPVEIDTDEAFKKHMIDGN